ncbi:MAG: hypothetical protein DHS20C16_03560 [Phycisphaerae bacterium]|nr:MAG: hypothetical protein DHS20C16_03560 [Phycisphaerae bacterium]
MNLIDYLKSGERPVQVQQVNVPEWGEFGDAVYVRTLSTAAVMGARSDDPLANILYTIIQCVCDKDGKAYFTDADRDQLSKEPLPVMTRLAVAANKLNEQYELAEEIEGN